MCVWISCLVCLSVSVWGFCVWCVCGGVYSGRALSQSVFVQQTRALFTQTHAHTQNTKSTHKPTHIWHKIRTHTSSKQSRVHIRSKTKKQQTMLSKEKLGGHEIRTFSTIHRASAHLYSLLIFPISYISLGGMGSTRSSWHHPCCRHSFCVHTQVRLLEVSAVFHRLYSLLNFLFSPPFSSIH